MEYSEPVETRSASLTVFIVQADRKVNNMVQRQTSTWPYLLTFSSSSRLTRSRSSTVSCVIFRSCSTFLLAFSTSPLTFFSRSRLSSSYSRKPNISTGPWTKLIQSFNHHNSKENNIMYIVPISTFRKDTWDYQRKQKGTPQPYSPRQVLIRVSA